MISANKIYKESGSSLPFKDWLEREKNKGKFIPNAQALKEFQNFDGENIAEEQTISEGKFISDNAFRNTLILLGLGIGIYLFYKSQKE
jgi:hypothetical protein